MFRWVVPLALGGLAAGAAAQDLSGEWDLRIAKPDGAVVVRARVGFASGSGASCMSGRWRKVVLKDAQTIDPAFFPVNEPLTWQIDGGRLIVGRNEICDAYFRLSGEASKEGLILGDYYSLGLGGGTTRGSFSLTRPAAAGR